MFKFKKSLKKHEQKYSKLNKIKGIIICLCLFYSIGVGIILLSDIHLLHENKVPYRYLFNALNLLLVLISFILLQWSKKLVKETYIILSLGLFLWASSLFLNLYNNINIPSALALLWMANIFKTIGILFLLIGAIFTIKKDNKKCDYFKTLATIDDLTEIPNRRYFYEELSKYENKMLLFMMIDIDNFKTINDKYGHEEGDKVLHDFGKILLNYKKSNICSARLGGDEFVAFIISDDKQKAIIFAEYLLNEINNIIVRNEYHITLSIGMAYKLASEPNEVGLQRADKALYKAKGNNRNRFEWEE